MHLAFVDITYGYTADRPDTGESLGGTTSAVCFTARALVAAGVQCTFFNRITTPTSAHGIRSLPLAALAEECTKSHYTAFIFCGRWIAGMVQLIKANTKASLIAWMHESSFGNPLVPIVPEFDGVSYVSEWQQRINQPHAQAHWKQVVIRNAMNPAASVLYAAGESIGASKSEPILLLFSGTAPRGVMHIAPMLEVLRTKQSAFTLELYCNTNPSGHATQDEKYITWLRSLPHVTHVGMVGQKELVQRMKHASILVAPNPWPETSCIAMIEAMAAGLSVVTTNRAVLPETAAGFARHIAVDNADDPVRFDMHVPPQAFAESVSEAMDEYRLNPAATEQKLRTQIDYCLANYQWQQRVKPWIYFLKSFQ